MLTNEQFFKLPKWAQNEINSLRNNNESLQKQLDEMFGHSDTNTFMRSGMDRKGLPNNSNIEFNLPNGNIEVRIDKGALSIYGSYTRGRLAIFPNVSNVVRVEIISDNH